MFASWSGMRGRSIWGKDALKTLLHVIIRCEWQKQTRNWFFYLWSSEVIPWTLAIVPEKPTSIRKGIAWWMWRGWLYLQVVLEILGNLRTTTKFTTTTSVDRERTGTRTSVSAGKRKLKQRRRWRQREWQKKKKGLVKQQPCTSITLFCKLLAVAARLRRETA